MFKITDYTLDYIFFFQIHVYYIYSIYHYFVHRFIMTTCMHACMQVFIQFCVRIRGCMYTLRNMCNLEPFLSRI